MKATCSFSTGICVFNDDSNRATVIDALQGCTVPVDIRHVVLGNIQDWQLVDASDPADLFQKVKEEYRLLRALLNIEQSLDDIGDETALDLLQEVEELLQLGVPDSKLCSRLLVGPLHHPEKMKERAKMALANGLATVANVLETVVASQTHISRIVGHWLEIPENEFSKVPGGRTSVWESAELVGTLFKAVQATNNSSFMQAWNPLILIQQQPHSRKAITHVAAVLANRVFPQGLMNKALDIRPEQQLEPAYQPDARAPSKHKPSAKDALERALKQINAIVEAVAQGQDIRARRFLCELVESQLAYPDSADHVVKSLCNVAQQCADLFRADFERECLKMALEIHPEDAWMLVQCGDHYKRVGEYDAAIDYFNQAKTLGKTLVDERIALSAIADVSAERGDFDRALELYRSIPGAKEDVKIRTAIADNLRRGGRFAEALKEYKVLIDDGTQVGRALAGLGEIARREGRLEEAQDTYERILKSVGDLEERSRRVYRCSLVGVLMRRGRLDDAYRLTDKILQDSPFCMHARILQASVLGLQGKAHEAIGSFPTKDAPAAFGEWVQQYVRGLLLLQLDRYDDAQKELIRNLDSKVLDGESIAMLRLAAAVSFLEKKQDIPRARELLLAVPDTSDAYTSYLTKILRYHVAVAENDVQAIARLEKQLSLEELPQGPLLNAFGAIRAHRWEDAWQSEVAALLRFAA